MDPNFFFFSGLFLFVQWRVTPVPATSDALHFGFCFPCQWSWNGNFQCY